MKAKRERRKLERFDLKVSAKIEVINSGRDKENRDLVTKDICAGGAFIQTAKPLPEGTIVKIDIVLPLDKLKALKDDCQQVHLKLTGRVLRSESTGMALCFNKDYQICPWKVGPIKPEIGEQPSVLRH